MSPAALALLFGLIEEAVKVSPQLAVELQTIFSKPDPTPEDWKAAGERVRNASYASFVPNSDLATAMDAGRVTAEHLAYAPFPAMVDPISPVTDQAAASDPSPVTIPGPDTPAESPAPAPVAPLTAAHVFALATMRA